MPPLPSADRDRSRTWKVAIRTFLSAIIVGFLVYKISWTSLGRLFSELHLGLVAAGFIIIQIGQSFSSLRWKMIAKPLGFTDGYGRFRSLFYIGTFFNLFLPTSIGGDAVRAWLLAGGPQHRLAAFSSVIADRVAGVTAMLMMACLATLVPMGDIPWWIPVLPWGILAGLLLTMALLPKLKKYSSKVQILLIGLGWEQGRWRNWWKAIGISFIVQGLATLQVICLGYAFSLPVPLAAYLVVVPLVTLMTMLPITLSGHGIREGSLLVLLAPYGVTTEQAVSLGLLWFILSAGIGLIGGLFYIFSERAWMPDSIDTSTKGKDSHESVNRRTDEGREGQRQAAA